MVQKYKEWFLMAAIMLVTFLAFSPVMNHDFVDWDDDVNVTENPNVKEINATTLRNIFTGEVIGGYTPLTTLSFAIEHALFGMKPGVFHTTNLILHLLCTLLVFILVRRLGFSLFVACATSLLFGIHPMRVESVAWITERKDVLYGLFFLASLVLYTLFRQTKKQQYYILSLLLFVLSLLSKIQAVTLPLVLIIIDYLQEKRFFSRQLLNKIPFLVLSLIIGIAGILLLRQEGSLITDSGLPFFERIFVGTYSLCLYLFKVVIPYPLSAIYPMPETLTILFYISAIVVIILAWGAWKYTRKNSEWAFGILFFLFNVIFMLQIVGAGTAFLADRFTYIAYIGLFLILARLAEKMLDTKWKLFILVPGISWVIVMGMVTWVHSQLWRNSETLFTHVIKKYPNTLIAQNNLGIYYRQERRPEKAIEAYSKAIAIKPDGYLAYSNRGEVYFEIGELDRAYTDISKALSLNPDNSQALSNRAAIYGSRKQYDLALSDLKRAVELDSNNLRAWSNLLLAHYTLARYDEAVNAADSYLRIEPKDAVILNQRGLCYGYLNRDQEALADFNRAIELNPEKGYYYQNRSYQLSKMGTYKNALFDILKAQELGVKINLNYLRMLQSR